MSKKDFFRNSNKYASSVDYDKINEDLESRDFIVEKSKNLNLFSPNIDFSKPENFARYGFAEEYYKTSFEYIYKSFPYDGSFAEKEKWYNKASYLDRYIFENEYPRTNGYANFGFNWGTKSDIVDYSAPSDAESREYITLKGGPNPGSVGGSTSTSLKSLYKARGKRKNFENYAPNVFKSSKKQENNLKFDSTEGVTVEFWLNKGGYSPSLTKREVLFDLWNSELSSSANYGRLTIELSASAISSEDTFRITCQSGSDGGAFDQGIGTLTTSSVGNSSWTHYAFSFLSASSGIDVEMYRNGTFKEKKTIGTKGIGEIEGGMQASIGGLLTTPSGSSYHGQSMAGFGSLVSSSVDEFRFWKKKRSAKQIFANYNCQVGGGTNTDEANTTLGVYYKFNEGITGRDSIDKKVLDYSGRVSNGTWNGYRTDSRSTGSAIVISSASYSEYKDPIIYSFHPDVVSKKEELENSGSVHDLSNNSLFYHSFPTWIVESDQEEGKENLKKMSQVISSYFDTLYIQIEQLNKLKDVTHTSGSIKPNAFIGKALEDKGVFKPEMFVDADLIESFYKKNEKTDFKRDLVEVKNKIYENLYNNISFIYKSKGTQNSFNSLLNTLGVSRKIVDVNMYSSNGEYYILDERKQILEKSKVIDLFKPNYNSSTICQHSQSAVESRSYISGSDKLHHTPLTLESTFTIPKNPDTKDHYYHASSYLTCSLFGFHSTGSTSEADLTWPSTSDDVSLQAYAIRDKATKKAGKFLLTGSIKGTTVGPLTSDYLNNLFDNSTWTLAIRVKPSDYPLSSRVSGAYNNYTIEMKGINDLSDSSKDSFLVSDTLSKAVGQNLAESTKRVYLGAHKENFSGSVYQNGYSFAQFSNLNFWLNYVSDEDLNSHLVDHKNYGISKANQSFSLLDDNYSKKNIPNSETLVLRWDFETVTGSDSSGNFIVDDVVSGSSGNSTSRYGFLSDITRKYQYLGKGYGFPSSDSSLVKNEYVNSYKFSNFESITSNEMINIMNDDSETFGTNDRPTEYHFMAEKSFYSAVNEKVLETFSTLKDFNNLIGDPINRYKEKYDNLAHYRKIFFEKVQSDLDFEKFIEFYKWIDSSVSELIYQLVPLSANFDSSLSNVVESHILERNKYQHKLPLIKPIQQTEVKISSSPVLSGSSYVSAHTSSIRVVSKVSASVYVEQKYLPDQTVSGSANFRNFSARKAYNLDISNNTVGNFHDNLRSEIVSGATGLITASKVDNQFVSRAIPASSLQYSWITHSYDASETGVLNEQTGPEDIVFSQASGHSYGWVPFSQLRGGELQAVKNMVKDSVYSIADDKIPFQTSIGTRVQAIEPLVANSVTNYFEPVASSKSKPLKIGVELNDEPKTKVELKTSLSSLSYANPELNNKFGLNKISSKEYSKILGLYKDGFIPEDSLISKWNYTVYSEDIWPKEKFYAMKTHRGRDSYASTDSELQGVLCSHRTIWRDSSSDRKRTKTAVGNFPFSNSKNSMGVISAFSDNVSPLSDYSGFTASDTAASTATITLIPSQSFTGSSDFVALYYSSTEHVMLTASSTGNGFNSFLTGSSIPNTLVSLANTINTHPTASLYFLATGISSENSGSITITSRTEGELGNSFLIVTPPDGGFHGGTSGTAITQSLAGGTAPVINRDGELNSSFQSHDQYKHKDAGTFGRTITIADAVEEYSEALVSPTLCHPFTSYYYPTASLSLIHTPKSALTDGVEVAPYHGHPWKVPELSGRTPFYDTYEDYFQDIKVLAKGYSTIPEFNISDHIPYYVDENSSNFRVQNNKIFKVYGTGKESSATETSSVDSSFYADYVFSENLKAYDSVRTDHKKVGEVGSIKLTCSGLKKFRPQQGFYPQARTVQLGTLLSQSIGPNISGLNVSATFSSSVDGVQTRSFDSSQSTLQAAIQPLFAPGILYNSVKSGIAVDYPIVFSGSLTTSASSDFSSHIIASNFSKRIPFEAIVDLDKFVRHKDVLYLSPTHHGTSSTCSKYPYFNWTGEKSSELYEKAANNFIAEASNFFLKEKNYTNFESAMESDFKSFQQGKTYYMDVSLKQTDNHYMWEDYYDGTVANAVENFSPRQGRAFGPPSLSVVTADPNNELGIATNVSTIAVDPAYLPHTPPYFYGENIARISFKPDASKSYTLSEVIASSSVEEKSFYKFSGFGYLLEDVIHSSSAAFVNKMPLSSSVNLFSINSRRMSEGSTSGVVISDQEGFDSWKIQSKFECPTLNFYNQASQAYMSRGMWGGFGVLPSGSEGIFLSLKDSFTGSFDENLTGSLIDQLGFKKGSKRIGEISQTKYLKEAIVAIPFLEREKRSDEDFCVTNVESKNLFKIDKEELERQLREGENTTITNMYNLMKEYVIPPRYNFVKYDDIDPFVMYMFEFKSELSQQDLSYIWQGVLPDCGLSVSGEDVVIEHKTGHGEFFHGNDIPSDIRWMVFKVKQKAEKSYYDIINNKENDDEYSYNWPYDYCSLVEVAKVDVSIELSAKKDKVEE